MKASIRLPAAMSASVILHHVGTKFKSSWNIKIYELDKTSVGLNKYNS